MIRVAALLGLVFAFFLGRARCPHCEDAMRRVRVANRDRDLYLNEARYYVQKGQQ